MYHFGWFSTGRDKAARDLLTAVYNSIKLGEINADIAFVFSSREPGESKDSDLLLELARTYYIPLVSFSYQRFKSRKGINNSGKDQASTPWRLEFDREVMSRLSDFHPDLCVLAGYMLIVGKEMCQKYNMINLHPAAPGGPSGTWQEVIWQLIERRADETGIMMHLVTPDLDQGPPVTYCTFPIKGRRFDKYWAEIRGLSVEEIKQTQGENNRLFRAIRRHGLAREFPLLVSTLKAFSEGRVKITADKKVVDTHGKPIKGYNLTDEIG